MAIAIGTLALHSPRTTVLAVTALVLSLAIFVNLTFGLAFLTLISFFDVLPDHSALNFTKPIGFVLTVSWAAALLVRGKHMPVLTRDQPLLAYTLFAFLGWSALSIAWADSAAKVESSLIRLTLAVVLILIVHSTIRTARELRLVAWTYLTGTALTTLYGFAFGIESFGRFDGGLGEPTFMASVLVASFGLAGFMLASTKSTLARLILVAFCVLDLVTLPLTQSRGGLVALGIVLVVAFAVAGRLRSRAIALGLVVAAIGVGYFAVLAPATLKARALNISAEGSTGRTDLWGLAWRISLDHPIQGIGLANVPVVESRYFSATFNILDVLRLRHKQFVTHNTYLEILAELGVVGLVLFASVIGGAIAVSLRAVRKIAATGDRETDALARGVITGVIGLLAAYVFLTGQYDKQLWLLVGLLVALPTVAESVSKGRTPQLAELPAPPAG